MYAADGRMAVQLMRVDRPRFGSEDASGGPTEQIGAASAGYVAYWGTYALDEGGAAVVHRVEGSLFPDWVGGEQPRRVALAGDRLTLSTPPLPGDGTTAEAVLMWRRAGSAVP